MAAALDGVPVAALPGDYRYRDPGNFAGGEAPDAIADQIATVGEDGDVIRSAPPSPIATAPTTTGAIRLAPPPERKGLFRRLFGG